MAARRRTSFPRILATLTASVACWLINPSTTVAQSADGLAGVWVLQPGLSQVPAEAGWNMVPAAPGGEPQAAGSSGGRRGGRVGAGSRGPVATARSLSEEDVRRAQQMTLAVRHPASRLIIRQDAGQIMLSENSLPPRVLHPGGREDLIAIDQATVVTTSRWEANRLVIRYTVDPDRELRYELSRTATPPQLHVNVSFLGLGGGDVAHLVYLAGSERDAIPPPVASPPSLGGPLPTNPGTPTTPRTAATGGAAQGREGPGGSAPKPAVTAVPDAELKGIRSVGLVVEGLDQRSTGCGLELSAIESAVSKELGTAGLVVRKNADDDAYFYVNVLTSTPSTALCVSRYDVILYTHATTTLSHQDTPTLVEVSLLRKGGLAGGAPSGHGSAVTADIRQYVAQFAARIAAANR